MTTDNLFKMKCEDIGFGTGLCAISVNIPFGSHKAVSIDKCLLNEILYLWEQGIHTTGCCCGHKREEPYIGVRFEDIDKMKALGYKVQFNKLRPDDEDTFYPKTEITSEYARVFHTEPSVSSAEYSEKSNNLNIFSYDNQTGRGFVPIVNIHPDVKQKIIDRFIGDNNETN